MIKEIQEITTRTNGDCCLITVEEDGEYKQIICDTGESRYGLDDQLGLRNNKPVPTTVIITRPHYREMGGMNALYDCKEVIFEKVYLPKILVDVLDNMECMKKGIPFVHDDLVSLAWTYLCYEEGTYEYQRMSVMPKSNKIKKLAHDIVLEQYYTIRIRYNSMWYEYSDSDYYRNSNPRALEEISEGSKMEIVNPYRSNMANLLKLRREGLEIVSVDKEMHEKVYGVDIDFHPFDKEGFIKEINTLFKANYLLKALHMDDEEHPSGKHWLAFVAHSCLCYPEKVRYYWEKFTEGLVYKELIKYIDKPESINVHNSVVRISYGNVVRTTMGGAELPQEFQLVQRNVDLSSSIFVVGNYGMPMSSLEDLLFMAADQSDKKGLQFVIIISGNFSRWLESYYENPLLSKNQN